jgi:hypothetical protein
LLVIDVSPGDVVLTHIERKLRRLGGLVPITVYDVSEEVTCVRVAEVTTHASNKASECREPGSHEGIAAITYNLINHAEVIGIDAAEVSELKIVI